MKEIDLKKFIKKEFNMKKIIVLLLVFILTLSPSISLAAEGKESDVKITFNGKNYKIESIQVSDKWILNRITNLSDNKILESYLNLENKIIQIEENQYRIIVENENYVVPFAVCTPGQTRTRTINISLFDLKMQDYQKKGIDSDIAFLALLTGVLTAINPLAGIIPGFLSSTITGGATYDLYMSYKNGDLNKIIRATYYYECVEVSDYDPGFDYGGESKVPMWKLVDIKW